MMARTVSAVRLQLIAEWYSPTQGGERVLKMDGAFAPKVLRFDTAFGCEG